MNRLVSKETEKLYQQGSEAQILTEGSDTLTVSLMVAVQPFSMFLLNFILMKVHHSTHPIAPALICSTNSCATPLDLDVFPFPGCMQF